VDDAYLQPYRDAVAEHGRTFEATLWARPQTQILRFEVMVAMVDLRGKIVLDAGCSGGDFVAYLLDQEIGFSRYIGVDGVEEMIVSAQERRLAPSEFLAGDFVKNPQLLGTGRPDFVTISGTLNTMTPATAMGVLDAAWQGCREGLIFNFLSDRASDKAPRQLPPAVRLPTMQLMDWALTQTADVVFRQDYLPNGHDATILMHKR
jgi:SAM-dependent methyltransferase